MKLALSTGAGSDHTKSLARLIDFVESLGFTEVCDLDNGGHSEVTPHA